MRLFAAQDFIATRDRVAQEHGIALRLRLFPATCDSIHRSNVLAALPVCC
ncbi:MAG: hypothetical protein OHK0022_22160 [Roseiflexaceae bacterium]